MDKVRLLRQCFRGVSGISTFRAQFYCSKTPGATPYREPTDSIFLRISRSGHPTTSMAGILDQWLDEGRELSKSDFQRLVKTLRRYRRFGHALQVSEYMSDQNCCQVSPGDIAIRLDLISKVYGLEPAERYFDGIPDGLRGMQVYGGLLSCYAQHKSLEKAEAVMEKMREFGFLKTALSYNVMLKLYLELGQLEKADSLMQEMEQSRIKPDKFTFNIRLNAYGATSDIEGMEKLLSRMIADPNFTMSWNAYVVAANCYLKAGLIDKGLTMLRSSEHLITDKSKRFAYETLLSLYCTARNKHEVYRIWNLYKNFEKVLNSGYLCMISSLMKLDDIDGAERIFEEWDSRYEFYDHRILNVMISAYFRKGLWVKAEAYVNRFIESGKQLDATTWDRLATGYNENGQTAKSVQSIKKAILAGRPPWKPNQSTLAACLKYLKQQGDVEAEEELLKLLREQDHSCTHDKLVSKCNRENLGFPALDSIEREDHTVD